MNQLSNMRKILINILFFLMPFCAFAQVYDADGRQIDTTGIYSDQADSLTAAVFTSRQAGTYISKYKDARVEVISAAGLCKMACCNLAESFENSASVTVGYSDAVTGARQIRLLGLSGTYTQMLDENRPVMRGLAAPFGLSYVPGQWLESIQIAKGAASVINGVESMTGQINMEHRKPTDEKPLFINLAVMGDSKTDFNIASSLQLNDSWSTVILGHVSGNFVGMDHNGDSFLDDPMLLQYNLSNRWLYYAPSGVQVRFGVRAIRDTRRGGQAESKELGKKGHYMTSAYGTGEDAFESYRASLGSANVGAWGSSILNQSLDAYLKVGIPLNEDNSQNIAAVLDYNYQDMDSYFGATKYLAGQHSGWFNLLYQNELNESHKFTLGASTMLDFYNEDFSRCFAFMNPLSESSYQRFNAPTTLATAGIFGEYTYHFEEKFSLIAGLRGEWYKPTVEGTKAINTLKLSPRLTLKYAPIDEITIRANAGRGLRYSTPLVDNIGVFSTSKVFVNQNGEYQTDAYRNHTLEDSWILGGNITYYLPIGASSNSYISFDYFRTQFVEQKVVDYELPGRTDAIAFYNLSDIDNGRAFSDTYQLDFSVEPVERFTITLTGRYTNSKITLANRGLVEKAMTSRYKGVLNLQYSTNLNKWIFDFTASVNGPSRVYDFMKDAPQIKSRNGGYYSNAYPLLYAQVTRRFKGVDIYVGGENLTNFRQKQLLFGDFDAENKPLTSRSNFDASCVWGPIMGIKVYAGVRFTLWKTEK